MDDEPMPPVRWADLIDLNDLAAFFKVKPKTVSKWRYEEPPMPSIRFKNRFYYSTAQIGWWMNRMQEHPDQTRLAVRKALREMKGEA